MMTPLVSAEQHLWRANTYSLLAGLLGQPPEKQVIQQIARIQTDKFAAPASTVDQGWVSIIKSAGITTAAAIDDEFHALFVGMTRGEVMPYASWYLTGFLMEKPLAAIRRDLKILGIERIEEVHEPEDHVTAMCEVMFLLIQDNRPEQRDFFNSHMNSWIDRFFRDLAYAKSAEFYRSVGQLGLAFMDLEKNMFEIPPDA